MGNDDDDDPLDSKLSSYSKHNTSYETDEYADNEEIEEEDEEIEAEEEEEDSESDLACPFCLEGLSPMDLFCHIFNEHESETYSGICPVCATNVGTSIATHLISKHGLLLQTLHKQKLSSGETGTLLSLLRKELQDKHLKSSHPRSSGVVCSSSIESDRLLMPFLYIPPPNDKSEIRQAASSSETNLADMTSDNSSSDRIIHPNSLPDKDTEEKALRFEFVTSILLSTILDDNM